MIRYLGDQHGMLFEDAVTDAEAKNINYIVQVGDFGAFFPTKDQRKRFKEDGVIRPWHNSLNEWIESRAKIPGKKVKILTAGGNHDNYTILDRLQREQGYPNLVEIYPGSEVYFVPRGNVVELDGIQHLFLGGAESTDKYKRIEGLDLWESREEASGKEFDLFFQNLNEYQPDTVITHDAPLRVKLDRVRRKQSITPNTLERIISMSNYHPKNWVFGHHHLLERWKVGMTKFFCCGLSGQYWDREDLSGWSHI